MEKLFIKTETGDRAIDREVARRYNLEKGLYSPFTHQPITNKNGEFPAELKAEKDPKNTGDNNLDNADKENVMFSTSEIIDFAQGTDSATGH